MRLSKRAAVILLTLMVFALVADAVMPSPVDTNVVQANAGAVLAIIVVGGIVLAVMGSGSTTKICDSNDPNRAQKIKDFFEQNRG